MKIVPSIRRRQEGLALWAAILLFVMFIIFIGTMVYVIWKAINRLKPRQPPPDDPNNALYIPDFQAEVDKASAEVQQQFGTTNVTALYLTGIPYTNIVVFLPFGTNVYDAVLERSTNLLDWQAIDTLPAGEAFIDTNPPPAQAFYRRLYLNVVGPVQEDTNHVPSFYYLPQ